MNRGLIVLTLIIALVAIYVGFKEPVAQTYNPIQTADLQNFQSAYIADLKNEEEIIIPIKVPKEIPEEIDNEPIAVPKVKPEVFGFIDTTSNIFNQVILAGYYLKNCANAQRASELINGTVIQPGEMFSFNKVVGSRTVSRGFIESRIIVGNRYETGVGGGVCRTSTALYQAAKQAGLQINEVHQHSMPVGYAFRGQDAAVWFNTMDLKITNTKECPILIFTINADEMLYVAIAEQTESEVITNRKMYDVQEDVSERSAESNDSPNR